MSFGIEGPGGEDPRQLVPAQPLDVRVCPPLSKARTEEAQVSSFLQTLNLFSGDGYVPLLVELGGDPPDRIVSRPDGPSWRLELTRLTLADVRAATARARSLGRLVEQIIRDQEQEYAHLRNRRVVLSLVDAGEVPRRYDGLARLIASTLLIDRGFVKEQGVTELPRQLPQEGHYEQQGPVLISVNELGVEDEFTIVASAQAELRQSEINQALLRLIEEKDRPENELLLISVASPDEWGYICQPDNVIFGMTEQALRGGMELAISADFLKGVYLHLWNTHLWLRLFEQSGSQLPW